MKIKLTSVFVADQDAALAFYTDMLGFVKKADFSVGEFKWLTVVSPEDTDGTELLLEPNAHDAARVYQEALYADGIPVATFFVDAIHREYVRLQERGVRFTVEPTDTGGPIIAILDDTCGNLIQICQV